MDQYGLMPKQQTLNVSAIISLVGIPFKELSTIIEINELLLFVTGILKDLKQSSPYW